MPQKQLARMGVAFEKIECIREKAGVGVWRVWRGALPPVILKTFAREEDRREISNYRLLKSLDIPTLSLLAATESAILLEDIDVSSTLRLGCEEDMTDPQVCRALGAWYHIFHARGRNHARPGMYDETDCITHENLLTVMQRTGTESCSAWQTVFAALPRLHALYKSMDKTLSYNDFYYTNLAVSRDKSIAFPFDYNLMGKGLAASDVRNATWFMRSAAKEAFFSAYGPVSPCEQTMDEANSFLTTLCMAAAWETFPEWAQDALAAVQDGRLARAITLALEI